MCENNCINRDQFAYQTSKINKTATASFMFQREKNDTNNTNQPNFGFGTDFSSLLHNANTLAEENGWSDC